MSGQCNSREKRSLRFEVKSERVDVLTQGLINRLALRDPHGVLRHFVRFDPALFDVGKSDWGSDKLTEVRQMRMGRLASGSDKEDERKERIDLA